MPTIRWKKVSGKEPNAFSTDVHLTSPKILDLASAVAARETFRREQRRIVLTNGCFDLLHPGHLYFLQKARSLGDALFVALNGDHSVRALKGPLRPVLGEHERAYALSALACVDVVIIFNGSRLIPEIQALRPDLYAKAGDYTLDTLHAGEREALQTVGASIHFLPFLEGFSTTGLIQKIRAAGGFA